MNALTLAVAGGRKTQSIVDRCVSARSGRRILVLTYTQSNQEEVVRRIDHNRPINASVEVFGWFSFLLNHWVRPYLPLRFTGRRLRGFNFDGDPGRYATGERRFLDDESRAYRRHLSRLAVDTNSSSSSAVLDRLSRIYDEICIDEVQDLNGYDLDILVALMNSPIDLYLVGDVRQALISTNIQDPRNRQYGGARIKQWFETQAERGLLEIATESRTWRSNQAIADFSDSIFDDSWGFARTVSENHRRTDHDGVFALATKDVSAYFNEFGPFCMRHSVASARGLELPFTNIGLAKGLTRERVLIAPTGPALRFLRDGARLDAGPACSLYVAVTRAEASVAFVSDEPEALRLPLWTP